MHPKTRYKKNHSVAGMPAEGMGIQARIQGFKGRGIYAASGGPLTFFSNLHLNKKKIEKF